MLRPRLARPTTGSRSSTGLCATWIGPIAWLLSRIGSAIGRIGVCRAPSAYRHDRTVTRARERRITGTRAAEDSMWEGVWGNRRLWKRNLLKKRGCGPTPIPALGTIPHFPRFHVTQHRECPKQSLPKGFVSAMPADVRRSTRNRLRPKCSGRASSNRRPSTLRRGATSRLPVRCSGCSAGCLRRPDRIRTYRHGPPHPSRV